MARRAFWLAAALALIALMAANRPAAAQDAVTAVQVDTRTATIQGGSPFFVQYGIAGKPTSLAIENTGRAWVTLPELNAIGVVSATATTSGTVTAYLARTYYLAPGSQPYDLALHGGEVWFTAYGGNAIGRLDPATDSLHLHAIPQQDSGPAGIAVASDGLIWFAQQKANSLGQFNPISGTFQSYPYPLANARLDQVATLQANSIWFTAPAINRISNFKPSTMSFTNIPTLPYTQPVGLTIEPGDEPWVSVLGGNAIGRYAPGTLAFWRCTALPGGDAAPGPQRIVLAGGAGPRNLFYINGPAQNIGRVAVAADSATGAIRQIPAAPPACTPLDLAVDSDNNAWFTCGPANTVVQWRSPFSLERFLPLLMK